MVSPEIFRTWAGIALVAGALERRVWVRTDRGVMFPNLYVLLVAPPGVGKYVIEVVRELWSETENPESRTPAFKVAPDSMTKASLIDALALAKRSILPLGEPNLVEFHSLLVPAEELPVLMPSYDLEFIGTLNSIWNNKPVHEETRRHGPARHIRIEAPQLNILAGVQPGWLSTVFPEEAWSTGLTSRMLMIYASDAPFRHLFAESPPDLRPIRDGLMDMLSRLATMYGEGRWEQDAADRLGAWDAAGGPPTPSHSRLANYARRRTAMVIKLSLISAISRTGSPDITLPDVNRALEWLLEAESWMPDIFRAMLGRSDFQVLQELHYYMAAQFQTSGRKPIHERLVVAFLSERVPSDRIVRMLEIAERGGYLSRVAGTTDQFVPIAKDREVE